MKSVLWIKKHSAHIFLGKVNQVLQINVVSVGPNVVVNEKVELVFDPIFEDKGQDSCSQLQEEDDTQEDGELKYIILLYIYITMRPRKTEKSLRKRQKKSYFFTTC